MRLADFILANREPILAEWEAFAREIWQGLAPDPATLRDHAEAILLATVADMQAEQTSEQQSDKSKGKSDLSKSARQMSRASVEHGAGRLQSGFDLLSLLSEYRALRASVIRLWTESRPASRREDLLDLTRFNESIDHSIAQSTATFAENGERSRQMFLAMLGHDLRNPLNTIAMSAQLLSLDDGLAPDSAEAATQIIVSAQAMAGIIDDVLDFATTRLGGTIPVERKPIDLNELCEEVVAEMRAGRPGRSIDVRKRGACSIQADRARLRQVISNLIGNAFQHGGGACSIALSGDESGDSVLLSVHNQGRPIPAEAFGTIFDPLVRGTAADSHTARRYRSIGLGLYIVREIVHAHGGAIEVQSSEEEGTTFSIRLPR
jgi:signal transduction histidine kinase